MWYVNMALWLGTIFGFFGWALFRIYKAEQLKKAEKTERTAAHGGKSDVYPPEKTVPRGGI